MKFLSGLVSKVKSFLTPKKKLSILCTHSYKENGQQWVKLGVFNKKTRFELQNKHTCMHCNDHRLEPIRRD